MLDQNIQTRLTQCQSDNLLRQRYTLDQREETNIAINQTSLKNFSSNDYLGLATHPKVIKAFTAGVNEFGLGSGSSPLVSGYYKSHRLLEENFAEFLNHDKAILFNSGYLANLGVITTFANHNTTLVSDKLCHASILDGIQLSRAKHLRFKHNNMNHLEKILEKNSETLILTESVFSMEGDISQIHDICKLAKQAKANLIIDDAHGIGILGKNGRGVSEHFNLNQEDVTCIVNPLGKAFGSLGAIVTGKNNTIDALIQFAKTYRYTTALPPAIAYATIESLKILQTENWRREKLKNLIQFFIQQANQRSLALITDDATPIKSILIGDNLLTLKIKENLLQQGFFISCIRPPTVPKGTARIRICLNYSHEENDIVKLLDLIADAYDKFK